VRICIHRGTKEIGGTCIEVESQGKRLVLDVGLPLDAPDADEFSLHPVNGFAAHDPSLLGVVISHPHLDHYGLGHRLPSETHFLIGRAAQAILSAASLFSPGGLKLGTVSHLQDRRPITLGPFTITPFLVDHSAYDSYAVLIEADGKRLFYTADFRGHGRKSSLFENLVANPPSGVDVLLMEGTCIGRSGDDERCVTEDDLVPQFTDIFRQTQGMPLVWCSGQNIDRIVTVLKACNQSHRQLILDLYTADILRATENPRLPQETWEGVRVFLPVSQKRRIIQEQAFDVSNRYRSCRIYPEQLAEAAPNSVMLFRPSMIRDLDAANCIGGASLVCSVWGGYLNDPANQRLHEWMQQRGIPLYNCHTSGHATIADLRRMRNAFPNAVAVPVHLVDRKQFATLFDNVELHEDGEWWEF